MREKLCQEDTSATTLHPPTCHANLCQLVLRQCETPASEAELRSAPASLATGPIGRILRAVARRLSGDRLQGLSYRCRGGLVEVGSESSRFQYPSIPKEACDSPLLGELGGALDRPHRALRPSRQRGRARAQQMEDQPTLGGKFPLGNLPGKLHLQRSLRQPWCFHRMTRIL
jgi:hypothetical protein